MRPLRVCLVLALLAVSALGAEITTDKDEVIKDAEIVSVDAKQLVYKANGKQITRPIGEILKIDFRDPAKPAVSKYSQIDLTDGTALLASEWAIKGRTLELVLLSGPTVKLPLSTVNGILTPAHNEKDKADWRNRVINSRGKEALVMKRKLTKKDKGGKEIEILDEFGNNVYTTFNLPATIGDGDEGGETIALGIITDEKVEKVTRKQREIHGLIFPHALDQKAPPVMCKLVDTAQNVVVVSKLTGGEGGAVSVTTPSGARMDFKANEIAQIDYTKGRLDFLSSLPPVKTDVTPGPFDDKGKEGKWYVYRDSNLDNVPIRLGGTSYRQGLTILPDVDLTWDLGGNYRQFEAIVGIDDGTKAEGELVVTVSIDNKETVVPIVSRTTKGKNGEAIAPARPAQKLSLNVKDATTLKISVKAKDELSGLSISVSLGDAKVSK